MRGESDLFEDKMDYTIRRNLTIIKWIGIMTIVVSCAVTLFMVLSHSECTSSPTFEAPVNLNQTSCVYIKQFYLRDHLYASVCNQAGHSFLDIRVFINRTATIRGITMEMKQWFTLKKNCKE